MGNGKGLKRSQNAKVGPITQTFPIRGLVVSNIDGAAGVAFGTAVLGGLPEGNILLLGAVLQGSLTEASANIIDTFEGDISVGSAPTADTTLSGAEVDIVPSTAIPAAVASVATIRAVSTSTEGGDILNNTGATLELNINLLIDDASINADDQSVTFDGALHLTYAVLGDD